MQKNLKVLIKTRIMKKYLHLCKKYYGSFIGAVIGLVLVILFYCLSEFQKIPFVHLSSEMIVLLNKIVLPLVLPIMFLAALVSGPLVIVLWLFLPVGIYVLAIFHIILTVSIYGAAGLGVHYYISRFVALVSNRVDKNS